MSRRVLTAALAITWLAVACSPDEAGPSSPQATAAPPSVTTTGDVETTTPAAPGARSAFYSVDERWLCRPDLADDVCDEDYDVTVVQPDGTQTVEAFEAATDPPADCFYVYPTVALDPAGNADIDDGDNRMESRAVRAQAARFGEVCRVFAPLYRQASLGAIAGTARPDRALAYGDVLDAFHHYLAVWNEGRPFVLIGHSQGSGILSRLVADEIDPDPSLRAQLVSALLIGISVRVPPGEDVGSDFEHIPACRAPDQTGCVISYASYRATEDGTIDGVFGVHEDDRHPLCTNPGALAGGPAALDPIFAANGVDGDRTIAAGDGLEPIATPWVQYPGLVTAECVTTDTHTALAVTVEADPTDPRPDDIGGDFLPGWGLHVIDVHLGIDALIDVVSEQLSSLD